MAFQNVPEAHGNVFFLESSWVERFYRPGAVGNLMTAPGLGIKLIASLVFLDGQLDG